MSQPPTALPGASARKTNQATTAASPSVAPTGTSAPFANSTGEPENAGHERRVQTTWLYTLGSIVFFFVAIDAVLVLTALVAYSRSGNLLDAAIVVLVLVSTAGQVRFCWFLRAGPEGGLPKLRWIIALFAPPFAAWILGFFATLNSSVAAILPWMAFSVFVGLVSKRWRWITLLAAAVVTLAQPVISIAFFGLPVEASVFHDRWFLLLYGALLPFMVLSSLWWWRIVVEIDRHRRAAADLAITRERLRFASDLHDIQGHHLQVIALKSELAERLLSVDPEAAREHVHETRMIAKEALEETRSLVAGYREVALDDELENAREVLSAAGAECELELEALPADPEIRRVLGLVVREATTNVLRHSSATLARIRLREVSDGWALEITNNGIDRMLDAGSPGNGLTGLRERVVGIGGRLETHTDAADDRFELRVRVPAQREGNR